MPTRRQNPESSTFRQDAFASSADFERGILGNLVAQRCQKLSDREDGALLWWLQQVSWRDGGLEKFAEEFLTRHQHLIGTRSMHTFGIAADRVYGIKEADAVRRELGSRYGMFPDYEFPLRGDKDNDDIDSTRYPDRYPATVFAERCAIGAAELATELKKLLLDPRTNPSDGLWNIPGLWPALRVLRDRDAHEAENAIEPTEVTRLIDDELDFALQMRAFVLIEGREGIGKSEGARNWCERRPGRAIYVRLESGADETTLYRSIARKIGTACSYTRNAVDMKARIQDTLQPGHLMVVLDEAHFLWPQSERSQRSAPKRVDWVRTALVDFNVPVALVSTPQYFARQCDRFRQGGWNANQIQRRLAHTLLLPEDLSDEDILRVCRRSFPAVPAATVKKVAALALGTIGYLTTISHVRKRADFLAMRMPGADQVTVIEEALRQCGLEQAPVAACSNSGERPFNGRLNAPSNTPISSVQTSSRTRAPRLVQPEVGA